MHTKLTLRLDDALIDTAKAYAAAQGRSVSTLVADYFAALMQRSSGVERVPSAPRSQAWEAALGPVTRSLVGIATQQDLPGAASARRDESVENAYYDYLSAKHQ